MGSTRPTHYYVVHDEIGIGADQLQGLTNDVSYMFARATKAVSLIPPAYYADLACERAREYLNTLMRGARDDRSAVSRGTDKEREARERVYEKALKDWGNGVHDDLKESMFYI